VTAPTRILAGLALPEETVQAVSGIELPNVLAFTTTRAFGTFGTQGTDPVGDVMGRWQRLQDALGAPRFATARQVHGGDVIEHGAGWEGWLRGFGADGHLALAAGTAMAVTIADCVPVFVVHPRGASALLHSGWRGTEAGITCRAIARLAAAGFAPEELTVAVGPAICGDCYEVSADVYGRLTGRSVTDPTTVDLRAIIADQARAAGVRNFVESEWCTRHHGDRFFSHRGGDSGRQLGVLLVRE
jgi:copper oxidase (laccase) domain-containing protein